MTSQKSGGVLRARRAAKYAWIEQIKSVYPIAVSCHVLRVSSSGYFRWKHSAGEISRRCNDKLALALIRAIHAQVKGEYGWPRIHKELQATGMSIPASTACQWLLTWCSGVLRHRPHQLLCGDITYIQTDEGWLYLASVMDMFSRQVGGWSLQPHMNTSLPKDAMAMAWWRRRSELGAIFHSDRDSQYCRRDFQAALAKWGVRSSMSRKGNCWDNSPIDSFWDRFKTRLRVWKALCYPGAG